VCVSTNEKQDDPNLRIDPIYTREGRDGPAIKNRAQIDRIRCIMA